ncbi:MAG: archaemetzincin family Zn-dependent metalloprotease [Desulfobacteraceae bacterium]|nr:archaemetzincin family Zn-dependent metalloprotease [Desulfobacteraceae bacterium]
MNQSDNIIISPVGNIPSWINNAIAESIQNIFGLKTKVSPLLDDISFAYDEKRAQYFSTQILEELDARAPKECIKILAVTKEDLFIPILTHVYGEAQLNGMASIVSISRLISFPDTGGSMDNGRNRIIKEAAHELGHTFDLRHCEDELCIMHYCRKIEDVDQKSDRFCRYCTILLSDSIKALALGV